jgi:hypothetical protein
VDFSSDQLAKTKRNTSNYLNQPNANNTKTIIAALRKPHQHFCAHLLHFSMRVPMDTCILHV